MGRFPVTFVEVAGEDEHAVIEADNCNEESVLIAAKFDKYARFFQRQEKDTDGIEKPLWRTRWSAPAPDEYERVTRRSCSSSTRPASAPPRARWPGSPTSPATTGRGGGILRAVTTPTTAASRSWRPRWSGCANTARPGPPSGASAATGASRCWTRSATPAGTPTSPAAARPPGKSSGAVRNGKPRSGRRGDRCARTAGGIGYTRDWSKRQSHPHLCENCQDRAVEAEQQAEADERERQEQERLRQEAEEQPAAQKAGGWLSRFRT
ncbi:hypothetical protein GCM10010339_82220 [Streptomyces alanosinicus]|uniref:Uncharacterized protein n=1 Tax=Streptomyces alanosinicus TaxID=68171 RepID=A0A918YRX8_9ACTN|nr:hypothetical protein GCM10010339_82220 [Streptomyces alanosinicus]